MNNSDSPYYVLSDHLNSSSILTDSTGTTAQLSDYKPFGSINYDNKLIDLKNDYKYTGKEADEENNLQYFGARYLDNQTARFATIDPVILRVVASVLNDPQSLNSYAYARNNPIVLVDSDGNDWMPAMKGVVDGAWKGLKQFGQSIAAVAQNPSLIITSPVDLAKQSYNDAKYLAESYQNDPAGTTAQMKTAFSQLSKDWNNLSDEQKGQIVGYTLEKGTEAYIVAKGVYRALSTERVSQLSTIKNTLQPNGELIGNAGSKSSIRIMSGTASDAQNFFNNLTKGGRVVKDTDYPGTWVEVDGGHIGIRTIQTKSPNTSATIDVNIPEIPITKVKFNP